MEGRNEIPPGISSEGQNNGQSSASSSDRPVEEVFLEQLLKRCRRKIKLNVGGRCFVTSLTTLTAEPDSMLAAMFSGRHKLELEDDMSVFIDRNGDAFALILEWLRTGIVSQRILENEGERQMVLVEAKYFQLEALSAKLEEVDSQPMEDESLADNNLLDGNVIKLNVGGRRYATTRTTLTSDSDSMLAAMFSGRHCIAVDEDGYVFIDRDGELFAHILNWLRSRMIPPLDSVTKAGLLSEAQYFQLTDLVAELTGGAELLCPFKRLSPLRPISAKIFYSVYQSSVINNQPLVLSYIDLRLIPSMAGLYLFRADFRGSDLSGVCLRGANLEEARLSSARFLHCDISNVNLKSALLVDAELDHADLRSAMLDRCRLSGASLVSADLRGAYMRAARLSSKTNLKRALTLGAHGLENDSSASNGGTGTPSVQAMELANGIQDN